MNAPAANPALGAATGSADIRIICSECGREIKGQVLLIEEFTMASPLFCSVACIQRYDPANMTAAKIASLAGRIPAKSPNALAQPRAEAEGWSESAAAQG